jgi:hypothetical protein
VKHNMLIASVKTCEKLAVGGGSHGCRRGRVYK